jgi:hypothetical protein
VGSVVTGDDGGAGGIDGDGDGDDDADADTSIKKTECMNRWAVKV